MSPIESKYTHERHERHTELCTCTVSWTASPGWTRHIRTVKLYVVIQLLLNAVSLAQAESNVLHLKQKCLDSLARAGFLIERFEHVVTIDKNRRQSVARDIPLLSKVQAPLSSLCYDRFGFRRHTLSGTGHNKINHLSVSFII